MSADNGSYPKIEIEEPTTFITLILRKADAVKEPDFDFILSGWCIIAAHGMAAALKHLEKVRHGLDLKGAVWKDITEGKETRLANGVRVQLVASPMYINEEDPSELKIIQPTPSMIM